MNKIFFLLFLTITALHCMQHEASQNPALIAALTLSQEEISSTQNSHKTKKALCERCHKEVVHLKIHMRIHTGEKPHTCQYCDKKFIQWNSLKSHLRQHTGELFVCRYEGCERQFSTKQTLTRHEAAHTNKKFHVCQYCGKNFAQQVHLVEHIRTHISERPYACTHAGCDRRFSQLSNLALHMRTQHSASTEAGPAPIDEYTSPILGKRAFEPLQETQNDSEKQQHLLDMLYGGAITLNAGIDPFANEDQEDTNYPELQRLDYE